MRFINIFRKKDPGNAGERELLEQFRESGDAGLLGQLYAPYMEMVFLICFKYLKEEESAKDAVMQIFEKLLTELRQHEVENFKSWLHSVARNHCLMQLRAARTFTEIKDSDLQTETEAEDHEVLHLREQQLVDLEQCMGRLGEEQQVSVRMFYLDQKCYKEIAEANGFEISQVKSFIQNGKRNLKICMEANGKR